MKFIDLFCGAGGVTTGIESAVFDSRKCAEVIACVNHDPIAIESHAANHPKPFHFTEDIRTLDVSKLPTKADYVNNTLCLWASLECTNFSKAKGGKPRDQDSRTLAEHLYRYIEHINPDYVMIENVREFMAWGPLADDGKPISMKNGKDYLKWVYTIQDYGYNYDHRLLNAADFGAHTSRIRFFGCFAKKGLPIVFPKSTYSKDSKNGLKKWKAVREVLDLEDEGESIFTREKPLVEKTLERIYAGLIKFVAGGKDKFLMNQNSDNPSSKVWDIDNPTRTVLATKSQQIISPRFITKAYSGKPDGKNISIDGPAGTITTIGGQSIVKTCFLLNYHHSSNHASIHGPNPVLTTHDKYAILAAYYGNGDNITSSDQPSPTLSTKDRIAVIQSKYWIDRNFTGGGKIASVEDPAGSVMGIPKLNLVEAKWLLNTNFNNEGNDIDQPAPVITANHKQHYLMNPQWGNANHSDINNPAPTLIARMDKSPPYLVGTETGEAVIIIYETDSPFMVKIKEFMAMYGICDIKMRMLNIIELKEITGFSKNYFLAGSKTNQKKFIGNAVPPIIPCRWVEAMYESIYGEIPSHEKLVMIA